MFKQLKLKAAKLQFCFFLASCNFYWAQSDTNKIEFAFLRGQKWASVPWTTPLPVTQLHKTSKLQQNAISSEQQPMKEERNLIRGDKEMRCQFPFWNELSRDITWGERLNERISVLTGLLPAMPLNNNYNVL